MTTDMKSPLRKVRQAIENPSPPEPYHIRRGRELQQMHNAYWPAPRPNDMPQREFDWRDHPAD